MCELGPEFRTGWAGWPALPRSDLRPARAAGKWVDLSHRLEAELPWPPNLPRPCFQRVHSMPEYPLNITEIRMIAHAGTHVDAPCHLFADGPDAAAIPFERMTGRGVVWSVRGEADGVISLAQMRTMSPSFRPGDIVLLETGWAAQWGKAEYHTGAHPSLAVDAARWLVDNDVKALGLDCPTPDLPFFHRPARFDWPVHRILLGNGRPIAENLTGLEALIGRRVEVVLAGLSIAGSDGAPARILARAIED